MKEHVLNIIYGIVCMVLGIYIGFQANSGKYDPQPTPQPFQLETVQLQRGNTLITVCIDKRTQQAVPCTAYFLPL